MISRNRAREGGRIDRTSGPKGPNGRNLCRWCASEVPPRRFTFCSDACVHQWKLRTDTGYLRDQVFLRDRGVCASCGAHTEALRMHRRKLDYRARRRFDQEWGVRGARRSLWDADHIIPVAEGGGECDLDNMRTLCLKCHRIATAALRKRLAELKQAGTDSIESPTSGGGSSP